MQQRLVQALQIAADVHQDATRFKGVTASMVSHVMGVCELVARYGGTHQQQEAALLHETVDEPDFQRIHERVAQELGAPVATLLELMREPQSESEELTFLESKENYLKFIAALPAEAAFVLACDELHDLHCVVAAVLNSGPSLLDTMPGETEGVLWYYGRLPELCETAGLQVLLADVSAHLHLLRRASAC